MSALLPPQHTVFIAADLDTVSMSLKLPPERVLTLRQQIVDLLSRQKAPASQILKLLGTMAAAIIAIPLVLHYVKNIHFTTKTGDEVFFDGNGDAVAAYNIINLQIFSDHLYKLEKVGRIDPWASQGKEIVIDVNAVIWNEHYTQIPTSVCSKSCTMGHRKIVNPGKPPCCFDCVPCSTGEIANETDSANCLMCPEDQWTTDTHDKCIEKDIEFLSYEEPLGKFLAGIAVTFFLMTLSVLLIFIKYKDTPIVKANNRSLSYFLLLSLMFCFLCTLLFIGYPLKLTCTFQQPVFGIIFSICISSVLAKTVTVIIAFKATKPESIIKKRARLLTPKIITVTCPLIQVIICTVWLIVSCPFPYLNAKSNHRRIIAECNEGSKVFFYVMLGYTGSLAIMSFIVAFLARKLPGSFNEAKHITFSLLIFVSVWILFIPAYLSTQGKYTTAVEIFAILSSSAALLGCIFFGRCYIILIRPEKNNKDHLRGKDGLRNKIYSNN
ncbi:vomeronasal type-2 receptor 116-like [Protopterus annectens]|uniref:vomeronasal type-2 receptor 116-like n=1 Tax=Protopterus annectens TaxID=7888 RepID=UPI001CF970C1|nr:vomeronasal type-2 receptor 116-like [Protopterus annectens]